MRQSPTILIISYSLSSQTNGLLHSLITGLESTGCHINHERLNNLTNLRFPIGSVPKTISMMVRTLFRQRQAIAPLSPECTKPYDLVIIAGPTWSYNPSGPILSFFDRDGASVLGGKTVIPLISCRGYWRMHLWGIKRLLHKCQAQMANAMIFSHPTKEPWRTLGVFLKLSGRHPEKMALIGKHYHRYGHAKSQQGKAEEFGRQIGNKLIQGESLTNLDFHDDIALP